jgi:hypothetical protein
MATATDDIGTRALLTALNISAWSGNRLDRNASRDLTDRESAQRGAARVNKSLVSKDALAAVTTAAGAARSEHYKRTLAWADDGARILPAAGFLDYRDAMAARKSAFLDAVRVFTPSDTITTAPRRSNHSAICTAPQIIPKPPKSQRASVLPSIFSQSQPEQIFGWISETTPGTH